MNSLVIAHEIAHSVSSESALDAWTSAVDIFIWNLNLLNPLFMSFLIVIEALNYNYAGQMKTS